MYKSQHNIRKISFDILYNVFFNDKLLNVELNNTFNNMTIDDINKAFIKKECTGVIENVTEIDDLINKYSKVKTNKLDKSILVTLRLAIYELKHMDKVPVFATINETVNLVKKTKNYKLSGYVNAVLRNISRKENLKSGDSGENKKHCYFRIYNGGVEEVLKELENKNITYSKYNGMLDYEFTEVYYVERYKDILELDSFKKGYILIMDASSAYLTDKLAGFIKTNFDNKNFDLSILDVCASPGGKTLSLIDLIKDDFKKIVATARDVSEEKISKIVENAKRLNISNIDVSVKDATIYDSSDDDKYDVLILDVPCTGLGVIDKKPDIKLKYTDEKRDSLVEIQRKILDSCKHYVKRGGIISYSTCTETKEENEDNVQYFINNNTDFEVIFEKKIYRNDNNSADGFYMCFMKRKW